MEYLLTIILGVIGSILACIICYYVGHWITSFFRIRTNKLRSILPFDFSNHKTIMLTYAYISPTTTSTAYVVEQGDLMALIKAYDIAITMIEKDKRIHILDGYSIENSYTTFPNIFSISGPKWNPITKILLGQLGAPIEFFKNSSTDKGILVKTSKMQTGTSYKCEKTGTEKLPKICYGVIFAGEIENNDGSKQNILICAGSSTLSTNGCLLFLSQLSNSKFKVKQIKNKGIFKQKKWGILLKIENNTRRNRISSPLHTNDVTISVEKTFFQDDFLFKYEAKSYPNQI